ncbi:MAG: tetratricopeptide repeat protein [Magnetococcales bacterium]|nr:tetratricopeptide repeat protein [Magnetococcales bacterium]
MLGPQDPSTCPLLLPSRPWFGPETPLVGLAERLSAAGRVVITQNVPGSGGMGKSRLVQDYLRRHRDRHAWVWWLRDGDPLARLLDGLALADHLQVPARDDDRRRLQDLRHRLAREPEGLLILDDVASPRDLPPFLPPPGQGCRVILTTPWRFWGGTPFQPLVLGPVTEQLPWVSPAGETEGAALVAELGGVPLGLDLARAFLRDTGVRPRSLGDTLRERRLARERQAGIDRDRCRGRCREMIVLVLKRLAQRLPPAYALLQLLALCSGQALSIQTVRSLWCHLPRGSVADAPDAGLYSHHDPDALLTAAAWFAGLDWDGQWLVLHPLMRGVLLDILPSRRRALFNGVVLAWVREQGAAPDCLPPNHWLPAAVAAILATPEGALEEPAIGLLDRLGQWARARDWPGVAEAVLRAGIGWLEQRGDGHRGIARLAHDLGAVLQEQGNPIEARSWFERALGVGRAGFGDLHPVVSASANSLGLIQRELGDLAAARESLELALILTERRQGRMQAAYAAMADNLGGVLRDLGEFTAAARWFRVALEVGAQTLPATHPALAVRHNNLSGVQKRLGDLAGAVRSQEQALAILESHLGPDHPQVGAMANNLGATLRELGDHARAEGLLRRALDLTRRARGAIHPEIATIHNNLGLTFEQAGQPQQALEHFQAALDNGRLARGPVDLQVVEYRRNLARILQSLGRPEPAIDHCQQCLAVLETILGPTHPAVARAFLDLSNLLHGRGDLGLARQYRDKGLRLLGPDRVAGGEP